MVLALRSEFEPAFLESELKRYWTNAAYIVPVMELHELREVVERPAQAMDLAFEPPELVDTLIQHSHQAPSTLAVLSFALSELYAACARRNGDRLLTKVDYERMGGLAGALGQRADDLLSRLATDDPAYQATARRVFLRMIVQRRTDWSGRRASREEFVYADHNENKRVTKLLEVFRDARLLVSDQGLWQPAHDWLVQGWPLFRRWRGEFGAAAFEAQLSLNEAAQEWQQRNRAADLWTGSQLRNAAKRLSDPESSLNRREREFLEAGLRRRRRVRLITLTVAIVVVAAILGGLAIQRSRNQVYVEYYRDFVRRWGEPEGVDRLTDAEARARAVSIKLVRRGSEGHVEHAEIVRNGVALTAARLGENDSRPELDLQREHTRRRTACQWDFRYESASNSVEREIGKDIAGHQVYRLQYQFDSKEPTQATLSDERGNDATTAHSDASRVDIIRSSEGRDVEKTYRRGDGTLARNGDGVMREVRSYDGSGRVVRLAYFDGDDEPVRDRFGVAGSLFTFGPRDCVERRFFDAIGRPVRHSSGAAAWRLMFDREGRPVEQAYLDDAGRLTRNRDGVAVRRSSYDATNHETRREFLDEQMQPTRDHTGCAGWTSRFDAAGNEVERRFFDEHGASTECRDGRAGWQSSFDAQGNEIERMFLDKAGQPAGTRDGYAGWRSAFDDQGNETERAFVDETRHSVRLMGEHTGWRSTFNPRGNETRRMFIDEDGRPVRSAEGSVGWSSKFDGRDNEIEHMSIDADDKPIADPDGVVGWRSSYDTLGNEIERTLLGRNGRPIAGKDGYAIRRSKFDAWGNEIEHSFFSAAGKPTSSEERCAGWRSAFDTRGNETQRMFVDEHGRPTRRRDKIAGYRATFDAMGNEVDRVFLDEAERPIARSDGVASIRQRYDARGELIAIEYYDHADQMIASDM